MGEFVPGVPTSTGMCAKCQKRFEADADARFDCGRTAIDDGAFLLVVRQQAWCATAARAGCQLDNGGPAHCVLHEALTCRLLLSAAFAGRGRCTSPSVNRP